MLFDLRARGRRRAIQAIYLTLAILMGGGLVLFGIGGNVDGGLIDAFRNDSQRVDDDTFLKRAEAAERRAAANPRDARALAEAARARFQVAGQGENFDSNRQVFTDSGLLELRRSAANYEKYLAVVGDKVDVNLASLMVQAYAGLEQFDKAATAIEIVAEDKKTYQLYVQLATYAYAAGQTRKGDLAGERATELAPKEDRELVKGQLESAKSQGAQAAAQQGAQP